MIDPNEGIKEDNLYIKSEPGEICPHIRGNKPGEYSCAIHDEPWYYETPCASHGQIEKSPNTLCRFGKFLLEKANENDQDNSGRPCIR